MMTKDHKFKFVTYLSYTYMILVFTKPRYKYKDSKYFRYSSI